MARPIKRRIRLTENPSCKKNTSHSTPAQGQRLVSPIIMRRRDETRRGKNNADSTPVRPIHKSALPSRWELLLAQIDAHRRVLAGEQIAIAQARGRKNEPVRWRPTKTSRPQTMSTRTVACRQCAGCGGRSANLSRLPPCRTPSTETAARRCPIQNAEYSEWRKTQSATPKQKTPRGAARVCHACKRNQSP